MMISKAMMLTRLMTTLNDSYIDENSSGYDDHSSVVGAANMDDE